MQKVMPYKDIDDVLRHIRLQTFEGIPYAKNNLPPVNSPQQLWNVLKPRLTYVADPKGRELLQSLPTLMSGKRTGVRGGGDCDCFTIAALTMAAANNLGEPYIVLAGRDKRQPVHIYNGFIKDGKWYTFDLTEPFFDRERFYPYKQHLKFNY